MGTTEKTEKKEHIMQVAEQLFSEMGYDGASTRAIAQEANVNMAMLNYYFGSKEGLFKAIIANRMDTSKNQLEELIADNTTAWEKLQTIIDWYSERLLSNSCFQRIIQREITLNQRNEISEYVTSRLLRNAMLIKKVITDGVDSGEFRDVDVDFVLATIYGTKNYLVFSQHVASAVLDKDLSDPEVLEKEIRPRAKTYLKDLFKTYLLAHDTNK
ncbi:MAG: TetR/AcrR family transcriptional regulator [Mucilaginibacter polytrichastri]|nr:TetR/AcrR family transcriptional regulator [Mucilaginibacter polytrichastri]